MYVINSNPYNEFSKGAAERMEKLAARACFESNVPYMWNYINRTRIVLANRRHVLVLRKGI